MKSYLYYVLKFTNLSMRKVKVNFSTRNKYSSVMMYSPFSKYIMKKGKMEYVCLKGE